MQKVMKSVLRKIRSWKDLVNNPKSGGLHLLPTSNWFLFETVGTNIEILYSRFELLFEKYSKSSFFVRLPYFMYKKCSGSLSNYTSWKRFDSNEESSRFYSISESTESNSIHRKISGNSGMVHLAKVNQTPPPTQCCSLLAE